VKPWDSGKMELAEIREGQPPLRPDPTGHPERRRVLHPVGPESCYPGCSEADHEPQRPLVTLHYPLDMHCVAEVLSAISSAYPASVVDVNGVIWDRGVAK
jgi:hypothetical protein